mmetsp:Transcript_10363/g.9995  ORF Transcript_10363/g.9995 Transcript_10363/m.9995 type:complete len:256 (-) Transcript_10363:217-984(-)|eukprot:CAMPEP_0119055642 /NCGR_PEP_ID=MMETSP1177-20130426/75841_1 /TAXON_ID=2985 /ORGANISM="Ochromonas sp, Strain CCMP1899" /LENGTH=255 /DNA_ID=CAMNT_0007036217 /DNA_START=94 /DNA_END=861 /DNA_ORIENTATION=+
MPPKKKGSKSPGGKKKKSLSRKRGGSVKVKAQLNDADCALPQISNNRNQAIIGAVASSDVKSLSRMVTHYHYDDVINAPDFNGSTPLHLACRKGDLIMTQKLLSYSKIDVNILEKLSMGGYSALHHACALGSIEAIKLLIENGADIDSKANSPLGERPLHICCKYGKTDSARELIDAGVQMDLRDNFGHNASYWAVQKEHGAMVSLLDLPLAKAATAQEYLAIMMANTKGYVLPSLKKKKKGGKGKSKSPGKKKK